jgi:membrane-associated phospholipid phosphatase
MHIYTLIYDVSAFKRMMYFVMMTYSATIIVYLLFPTCQDLRPAEFERNNFLTRFMASYYAFDTNTNVCPSIHVIGSFAVTFASFHCKDFGKGTKVAFAVIGVLIAISTVFVKQHSIIDLLAALPLCAVAYILCFKNNRR